MTGSREYEEIGIRPGEKLHEIMVPEEVSRHTLDFDDHYVIEPAITFFDKDIDYSTNKIGQKGKKIPEDFEYHSGTNPHFLTVDELKNLNDAAL
jgi:UDP-N-acetylglucosamine 4,6-dehydratase